MVLASMVPEGKVRTPTIVALAVWLGEASRANDMTLTSASTVPPVKSLVPTDTWEEEELAFISPIAHQVTRLESPPIPRICALGALPMKAGLKAMTPAELAEALSRPKPKLSA